MEIRNKVKERKIVQMDLADYKPSCAIVPIDLSEQLWKGLVLKEKDFRTWIKETDWSSFGGKGAYIYCSTDAIVPTWAFMLVSSQLTEICEAVVVGTEKQLRRVLILNNIHKLDLDELKDQRVIIKGCSDISEPAFAMSELVCFLQPVVKSIMYGEPCSTVPIFKRKKT